LLQKLTRWAYRSCIRPGRLHRDRQFFQMGSCWRDVARGAASTPRSGRGDAAEASRPRSDRGAAAEGSRPRSGRVDAAEGSRLRSGRADAAEGSRRRRGGGGATSQPQPRGCHRGAANLSVPSLPPPGPTPTMWDHGLLRNHNLSPGPAHVEAFFVCFRGADRPAGAAICNECAGCRFGAGSTDAGPSSHSLFPAGRRRRAVHKELL